MYLTRNAVRRLVGLQNSVVFKGFLGVFAVLKSLQRLAKFAKRIDHISAVNRHWWLSKRLGAVAEWSNVLDSKSSVPQGTVGSNPTRSASDSGLLLHKT